jgi:hypothetical protein
VVVIVKEIGLEKNQKNRIPYFKTIRWNASKISAFVVSLISVCVEVLKFEASQF